MSTTWLTIVAPQIAKFECDERLPGLRWLGWHCYREEMSIQAGGRRSRPRDHGGESSPEIAIITATEGLLASVPLHDLRVSAIIDAAGVSRPTFYFYFPSKYAVVSALLQRIFGAIQESVEPWLARAGEDSPVATLRSLLRMCARQWYEHDAVIRAAHENAHADPELGTIWFAIMERFRAILSSEIQRVRTSTGVVSGIDSDVLSATLVWASERTLYMTARRDNVLLPTPEAGAEGLLAIWLPAIYSLPYSPPADGE